jgi:hypothetical protein
MSNDQPIKADSVLLIRFKPTPLTSENRRLGAIGVVPCANLEVIEQSTGRDLSNLIRRVEIVFDAEADEPLFVTIEALADADMSFRALVLADEDDDAHNQ